MRALDLMGNPSSVHRAGRAARDAIDSVRIALASAFGVGVGQVVFTSGGTEANAIALTQVPEGRRYCSAVEHEAVLAWVPELHHLRVLDDGALDLEAAELELSKAAPGLVSLMLVNNTLGTIQPVKALADIAHQHGHLVHCDAVQAFGKTPVSFDDLSADFLTVSAHKIGGPKGAGALIVRDGYPLKSFTKGGGQERRRRPGTENMQGLLGFGGALEDLSLRLSAADRIAGYAAAVCNVVGPEALVAETSQAVPHIVSLHMPGVKSHLQLMRFDLAGICVSAGSACSSGKVSESHVIRALRLGSDVASESVRVSFGPETTQSDVDAFLAEWTAIRQSVKSAA